VGWWKAVKSLALVVADRRIWRNVSGRVLLTGAPQRLIVAADLLTPRLAGDALRLPEFRIIDVLQLPVVEHERPRRIHFQ
jgi:hypothetical protein